MKTLSKTLLTLSILAITSGTAFAAGSDNLAPQVQKNTADISAIHTEIANVHTYADGLNTATQGALKSVDTALTNHMNHINAISTATQGSLTLADSKLKQHTTEIKVNTDWRTANTKNVTWLNDHKTTLSNVVEDADNINAILDNHTTHLNATAQKLG